MAVKVLKGLQIELLKIRAEVEHLIHAGQQSSAKNVVKYALSEACNLQSKQVDTEHILLALLHEHGSVAAQVLENNGLTLGRARDEIQRINNQARYPNLSRSN